MLFYNMFQIFNFSLGNFDVFFNSSYSPFLISQSVYFRFTICDVTLEREIPQLFFTKSLTKSRCWVDKISSNDTVTTVKLKKLLMDIACTLHHCKENTWNRQWSMLWYKVLFKKIIFNLLYGYQYCIRDKVL